MAARGRPSGRDIGGRKEGGNPTQAAAALPLPGNHATTHAGRLSLRLNEGDGRRKEYFAHPPLGTSYRRDDEIYVVNSLQRFGRGQGDAGQPTQASGEYG
ncbi:hypothetical protein CLV84_2425 [Neolewinella xylanilytica]|uniref:Uncharacterized protein n=1 Tax=Neolewinella xylanilytica TaxID=1514080 RepID=A0A2S6I2W1_9BACT|nr:hypothetical protein CLV84_2425 [Neolewinella xylanilytica]